MDVDTLIAGIESEIINPLIGLIFFAGLFLFFWGFVDYLYGTDNPEKQKAGKQHMIWGVIGMTIMVSVYGIMQFICGLIGC